MPTINKVIVDGEEIINLDNDTLSSASQLLSGVTAHSNTGEIITGELEPPTGDISITENGSYNIAAYETATVNVSGEIPSNLEYGVDYPLSSGQCTHYHLNEEAVGIADYAFACDSNISGNPGIAKNITTFDNLDKKTSIGTRAFYGCSGLTSASLPQATSIGQYAFYSCTNLTSITIKNGVVCIPYTGNASKIATFNNHLYWQNGIATNKIYISDAVSGTPTTTQIGTLTSSNPSFTYTDGAYTITFARTGINDRFSISWTETP